jgi:hypothetical protein
VTAGLVSGVVSASPLLGETKSAAVHVGIGYSDEWNDADNSHRRMTPTRAEPSTFISAADV